MAVAQRLQNVVTKTFWLRLGARSSGLLARGIDGVNSESGPAVLHSLQPEGVSFVWMPGGVLPPLSGSIELKGFGPLHRCRISAQYCVSDDAPGRLLFNVAENAVLASMETFLRTLRPHLRQPRLTCSRSCQGP